MRNSQSGTVVQGLTATRGLERHAIFLYYAQVSDVSQKLQSTIIDFFYHYFILLVMWGDTLLGCCDLSALAAIVALCWVYSSNVIVR